MLQPADRSLRLPSSPYPGLRPFLPHEAALLFGRERQVREVIEHLRQTQFVAILGGSGSGKSSLIHAGVTPELRSFGIPGAGDFWLTMSCTPGTNVALQQGQQARYTPVSRLAWRFARLLRSRGSAEADAARLDEIAAIFRQEAGFARLLDRYAPELDVPPAFGGEEARVLFVLDQFEEIFHPTNTGVEDARVLVERVIDHFFSPHPHAYIVLTMRTEHLNDCATYLELPDAINRASYMVRRLGPDELREAITGPAQRYLRLKARAEPGGPWPEEVRFEEPLLQRLLADVGSIAHDPDHLPLLQHLLSRLWTQAQAREGGAEVPASLQVADLRAAVAAGVDAELDAATHSLRASLENWAEAAWRRRTPAEQAGLDALLRRMAYKDPNTGMFTQQRVNVDDAPLILGPGRTREDLRALVEPDFLGSVDYFFWDDDDGSRVTLKVSHESLIRGWAHFRALIDDEAERFRDFTDALLKCQEWVQAGRPDARLLERNDLRRIDEAGVEQTLVRPDGRAAWARLLRLDRLSQHLGGSEEELLAFIARSRHALDSEHGRRQRLLWVAGITLVGMLLLLPFLVFSTLIQTPVTKRVLRYYDAGMLAYGTETVEGRTPADADAALERLVHAAQLVEAGRAGTDVAGSDTADRLMQGLSRLESVRRQREMLRNVAALVEPSVNGQLRYTIGAYLWRARAPERREDFARVPPVKGVPCRMGAERVEGTLLKGGSGQGASRYLFVPRPQAGPGASLSLIPLRVTEGADLDCTLDKGAGQRPLLSIPMALVPRVVVDPTLRFVLFTQNTGAGDRSVTMYEVDWDSRPQADAQGRPSLSARVLAARQRAVVLDEALAQALDASAGDDDLVDVVPGWRTDSRRLLELSDGMTHWQFASGATQVVPASVFENSAVAAQAAADGSPCKRLLDKAQLGFDLAFEDGPRCLFVAVGGEGQQVGSTLVRLGVYDRPDERLLQRLDKDLDRYRPAPIVAMNQFARIAYTGGPQRLPHDWRVGRDAYSGWLFYRLTSSTSGKPIEVGAPWSTCALAREAAALLGSEPDPCDPRSIRTMLQSEP